MSTTVVLDERLRALVDADLEPQKIAGGCIFTEGPLWSPPDAALIFSDIQGDTMYRWTEKGGQEVFRRPSGQANGNTYDREGRLITCEHKNRRVSRTLNDGTVETLAGDYQGKQFNSPNDVVRAPNGDLYFTDPPFGLRQADGSFGPQEIPFCGVFKISHGDESVTVVADDFERPNGIVVSGDGSRMLIGDTERHVVRAFDLAADGSLSDGRVFADLSYKGTAGRADGLKLDGSDNLYVAANTAEGIWVYAPDGTFLGFIGVPERPSNIAWGGDGWRTLFITAQTSVYRLEMRVAGQPVS